eukprot:scaffold191073_cov33-Prasinocladus_malaysianus.AAC.1
MRTDFMKGMMVRASSAMITHTAAHASIMGEACYLHMQPAFQLKMASVNARRFVSPYQPIDVHEESGEDLAACLSSKNAVFENAKGEAIHVYYLNLILTYAEVMKLQHVMIDTVFSTDDIRGFAVYEDPPSPLLLVP